MWAPIVSVISRLGCETEVWCGLIVMEILPRIYLNSELDPELWMGDLGG